MFKEALKIRDRKTGDIYSCIPQIVDLNLNGKYELRYNIGINGYNEWSNICCVYDNEEFNSRYEVIEYHC